MYVCKVHLILCVNINKIFLRWEIERERQIEIEQERTRERERKKERERERERENKRVIFFPRKKPHRSNCYISI